MQPEKPSLQWPAAKARTNAELKYFGEFSVIVSRPESGDE
jgi:hypothetical protein